MTTNELVKLGTDKPVIYKGMVPVTFLHLGMDFKPWTGRRQPMKASIRLPGGRETRVFPSQLSPVPDNEKGAVR